MLRPEQLQIKLAAGDADTAARVLEVQYLGHDALARLRVDDASAPVLLARIPGELRLKVGQAVWIEVTSAGRAWPATGEPAPVGDDPHPPENAGRR
jgi:hypothetical protein